MYLSRNDKINESYAHYLFFFRYQIRKTMFTKLLIPVYQYTQKLILYHDIRRKYRYFDTYRTSLEKSELLY